MRREQSESVTLTFVHGECKQLMSRRESRIQNKGRADKADQNK